MSAWSGSQPDPVNRSTPETRVKMKRLLKAGDELSFSVLNDDGSKALSHTVRLYHGRFIVAGMDGADLGGFATLHAAHAAGFGASREALQHGL